MNTPFGRLMWAAVLKRASIVEAWIEQHAACYPGPYIENALLDAFTQRAACSCGASSTFTVAVSVEVRAVKK